MYQASHGIHQHSKISSDRGPIHHALQPSFTSVALSVIVALVCIPLNFQNSPRPVQTRLMPSSAFCYARIRLCVIPAPGLRASTSIEFSCTATTDHAMLPSVQWQDGTLSHPLAHSKLTTRFVDRIFRLDLCWSTYASWRAGLDAQSFDAVKGKAIVLLGDSDPSISVSTSLLRQILQLGLTFLCPRTQLPPPSAFVSRPSPESHHVPVSKRIP